MLLDIQKPGRIKTVGAVDGRQLKIYLNISLFQENDGPDKVQLPIFLLPQMYNLYN
jgi:hypothetical protein